MSLSHPRPACDQVVLCDRCRCASEVCACPPSRVKEDPCNHRYERAGRESPGKCLVCAIRSAEDNIDRLLKAFQVTDGACRNWKARAEAAEAALESERETKAHHNPVNCDIRLARLRTERDEAVELLRFGEYSLIAGVDRCGDCLVKVVDVRGRDITPHDPDCFVVLARAFLSRTEKK